jgi:hypothetical protein
MWVEGEELQEFRSCRIRITYLAKLRESDRTLRDGSFGVALCQALRARLRSHRPSRDIRNRPELVILKSSPFMPSKS